jgi:hypothetical protein
MILNLNFELKPGYSRLRYLHSIYADKPSICTFIHIETMKIMQNFNLIFCVHFYFDYFLNNKVRSIINEIFVEQFIFKKKVLINYFRAKKSKMIKTEINDDNI